jgi:hypothetical protein
MLNRFVLKSYLKRHFHCPPNKAIYTIEVVYTTLSVQKVRRRDMLLLHLAFDR